MRKRNAPAPKTVDEYLARVSDEQRAALESLRQTIKSIAPKAQERISYGMPAFHLNGMLVGFGATPKHCALYVMSGTLLAEHADLVKGYDTSKGTIRFQPDAPLPRSLVRTLVRARIAENAS